MKTNIVLLIFGFTFFISLSKAQDYHLSHYDVANMYLNPALTGVYGNENADFKIYANQRSQWRSLGIKPFLTSYIAYDKPYLIKDRNLGLGAYLINNNGGIGNVNTLTFMSSASYNILKAQSRNKHILAMGFQMGVLYRSFNPSALSYDVQYSMTKNSGSFDQTISSNETFANVSITRFDANYGLYYKSIELDKRLRPFAGFAMAHITRPNESMVGATSRMPIKWTGHLGLEITIGDKTEFTPRVLCLTQSKAQELTSGFLFYYRITENKTKIFTGLDYRLNDAYLINLGIKHESYTVRLSYDINTSYLRNFSGGRGAYEISLVYIGEKGKSFLKSASQM
jgi:type IX secretion system PorP/SprF family membrane protein